MNERSGVTPTPPHLAVEPLLPHVPPPAETVEWAPEWCDCFAEGAD